jgi:hypothetical protein
MRTFWLAWMSCMLRPAGNDEILRRASTAAGGLQVLVRVVSQGVGFFLGPGNL